MLPYALSQIPLPPTLVQPQGSALQGGPSWTLLTQPPLHHVLGTRDLPRIHRTFSVLFFFLFLFIVLSLFLMMIDTIFKFCLWLFISSVIKTPLDANTSKAQICLFPLH